MTITLPTLAYAVIAAGAVFFIALVAVIIYGGNMSDPDEADQQLRGGE